MVRLAFKCVFGAKFPGANGFHLRSSFKLGGGGRVGSKAPLVASLSLRIFDERGSLEL